MPTLFALCGLAFSGKTTLARAISRLAGAEYIGLDDINAERGLRGGEGIPVEEWEKASATAIERAETFLAASLIQRPVIGDRGAGAGGCPWWLGPWETPRRSWLRQGLAIRLGRLYGRFVVGILARCSDAPASVCSLWSR